MVNQHREVLELQKRTSSWALGCALVIAAVFLVFGERAFAKGLVLGTCFSILNFMILGRSIPVVLGHGRRKASMIGLASVLIRFALLAVPLIIAIQSVSFDFFAVVVGIFAVQIVTLVDYIVVRPLTTEKGMGK
jgi:hypothetical protein